MRYRKNQRTGSQISEIGIGTAYLADAGMEEGVKALRTAQAGGVNYYDLVAGDGAVFPIFGEAFHSDRAKVSEQLDLFDLLENPSPAKPSKARREKQEKLEAAVDAIRKRFGNATITLGYHQSKETGDGHDPSVD